MTSKISKRPAPPKEVRIRVYARCAYCSTIVNFPAKNDHISPLVKCPPCADDHRYQRMPIALEYE